MNGAQYSGFLVPVLLLREWELGDRREPWLSWPCEPKIQLQQCRVEENEKYQESSHLVTI